MLAGLGVAGVATARGLAGVAGLGLLPLAGCASRRLGGMGLQPGEDDIDPGGESIALLSIELSRSDENLVRALLPGVVSIDRLGAEAKSWWNYQLDAGAGRYDPALKRSVHLVSLWLEPGRYRLMGFSGLIASQRPPGNFFVPVLADFTLDAGSIVYLGRVRARLRPRSGTEFRAGPRMPLRDQAAAGLSTGSFDVSVVDSSADDLPEFRRLYPGLAQPAGRLIRTALLPAFDRATAQQWWESISDADDRRADTAAAAVPSPAPASTPTPTR